MKSNGESQDSIKNKFLFSNFFANLYYFFVMHIYVVLTILGSCIGIAMLLFVAELIVPDYVHLFNYSLTNTTFTQLVKSHQYHAAIAFLECKDNVVMNKDEFYKFLQELADCYIHTGDYPKALEQYQLLRKQMKEADQKYGHKGLSDQEFDMMMKMVYAVFDKEEFRIYLKMGDKASIIKHYNAIKEKYESVDWVEIHSRLSEISEDFDDKFKGFDLKDGFELELLQGEYIINPNTAISKMENFAIAVANSTKYNHAYKLKVFGELIGMLLEQNRSIAARHYLEIALSIVDTLEYEPSIFQRLGDLSDYCYKLNDISDGKRLLKKYLSHIDDTYDESDIDYAIAHAKEFKYLQAEGRWDELTTQLVESSKALREQIARNFTGMTGAQREYFIEQFKPIFSYANSLLSVHPSDKLAEVCFENNMFLRGLLLRSESALANSIAAMGNKELENKYSKYVSLSQELVARQYVSGPGNYFRQSQIEKEIATIESELANASRDFRRENEKAVLTIADLRKSLEKNDVATQIINVAEDYFALLLHGDGKIKYWDLGSVVADLELLYTDSSVNSAWLTKLRLNLEGRNVYYSADGIFNKIALSSVPIESNGKTLGDIAHINLMGSLADIPEIKERGAAMNLIAKSSILWGGVEYGVATDSILQDSTDVIFRGEKLRYLSGSKIEVEEIFQMLRQNGNNPTLITGAKATEKSFVSRSHKKDYILHISTHGFFHDSEAFVNPMQNSGLLFANSQQYWMNDALVDNINVADGILRADEIAKLDLIGCRLVVLSACQTGLGESNSEGVYGLQRAFKLAGAENILMSLWSVDDAATRKLMTLFYSGLITGQPPQVALTNAQNRMRCEGYSPDKWAAFVLLN